MLEKREIKPADEFHRLAQIFNKEFWSYSKSEYSSVKKILDENFHNCSCRSSFLSIDDLLKSFQIDEKSRYLISWETLYTYCEILRNVADEKIVNILQDDVFEKLQQMMLDNINIILAKTNHGWAKIKEGYVIVDKNPATTEAIECLEEKDFELAIKMIEYNRVLLKGNLDRKREILTSMANYVEPWNKFFKETPYSSLYKDSRFLVNCINIRHNNSEGGRLPAKAQNWTSKEKEEWYDKTYHTLLMVILSKKQIELSKEIELLKD